ncbi:MAG TPA: hypothetical protein VNO75_13500 [Gemmatimonadaceae bacterium]|nr:hypothetical protein [Gemmatimonadaceae bacterium]
MSLRSKLWRAAAAVYVFINVAGAVYAAVEAEPAHAMLHVTLLAVGAAAYAVWRLKAQRQRNLATPQLSEQRIEYLQQSVDAIALEVERIGEKQRFSEKLRSAPSEIPLKKEQ